MRLTTTLSGHALMQDNDGWWCYAYISDDGERICSGCRVGEDVPYEVEYRSLDIPYKALSASATIRRKLSAAHNTDNVIHRIMSKTETKSDIVPVKHGIVILAEFKDVRFKYKKEDFTALLTQKGYSRNNAKGSAKEYFDDQFGGKIEFRFDVSDPVTLSGNRAVYGANTSDGNDTAPAEMVIEACRLADESIDFSLYDDDNDGTVDNVFVFFAGGDEAEGAGEDCIWSHAWYIYSGAGQNLNLDGKKIDRYACTSELSRLYSAPDNFSDVFTSIGSFCHEYSHTFGLPDFYDTDYEGSGGNTAGLWLWTSLMDGGNQNDRGNCPPYFNAMEREILGLSVPVVLSRNGTYELEPIHVSGSTYRIDTDHPDEYYLLECRSGEGWDSHIGGSGMLVYHIDKSNRSSGVSELYGEDIAAINRWLYTNEVNCRPDHQCADLIEADRRLDHFSSFEEETFQSLYRNVSGIFFPNSGEDKILRDRIPFWSGMQGDLELSNIKKQNGKITFSVNGLEGLEPPKPSGLSIETFSNAVIISFESNRYSFEGEATVEWGLTGREMEAIRVKPYERGKYVTVLEGLESGNKTYSVNISFEEDGIKGEILTTSFMTKRKPAVDWPYIHLTGVSRNSDGSFPSGARLPLIVYNTEDAAEISWTFNGRTISRQGNGYYTVTESGVLEACITYEDGSQERICKEIIIKNEEEEK